MTREQAIETAYHRAVTTGVPRYVVYEPDEYLGGEYLVCTENELNTFFAGVEPIYCSLDEGVDSRYSY